MRIVFHGWMPCVHNLKLFKLARIEKFGRSLFTGDGDGDHQEEMNDVWQKKRVDRLDSNQIYLVQWICVLFFSRIKFSPSGKWFWIVKNNPLLDLIELKLCGFNVM